RLRPRPPRDDSADDRLGVPRQESVELALGLLLVRGFEERREQRVDRGADALRRLAHRDPAIRPRRAPSPPAPPAGRRRPAAPPGPPASAAVPGRSSGAPHWTPAW